MDIMEQMKFIRRLPEPMEMKQEIPLKPEYAELKERRDKELADIMTGKDDRFLLIIGPAQQIMKLPCSITVSVLPKRQMKSRTNYSLFQEYTRISRAR